jgi:hypothetical protein
MSKIWLIQGIYQYIYAIITDLIYSEFQISYIQMLFSYCKGNTALNSDTKGQ